MAETTVRFSTSGMHCSSCAMLVDMTLGDLDGVAASRTDHATGETVVTYDDDVVSIEQMVQAVQSAGYEAEPIG